MTALRTLIEAVEAGDRLPSQEALRLMLRYEPHTGKLFWRERTPDQFLASEHRTQDHLCAIWNSRFAGKPALDGCDREGYRKGKIGQASVRAHRAIWKLVHNQEPEAIDHINGDKSDNRLENLRAASRQINAMNVKLHLDNKSGVLGVHFDARYGKWIACGKLNGKTTHIGTFSTVEDAAAARAVWQEANGFHPNHGRATNTGKE